MAYSSKYYDPVKAHEYYEKHKKLKGRQSTSGLSDEGKALAKYVKEQINSEKKEMISRFNEDMKARVKALREQMKSANMSKEDIAEAVASLKEEFKGKKEEMKSAYKEKYLSELDKIKADPQFAKKKVKRK